LTDYLSERVESAERVENVERAESVERVESVENVENVQRSTRGLSGFLFWASRLPVVVALQYKC
jgi:hypothetical protein